MINLSVNGPWLLSDWSPYPRFYLSYSRSLTFRWLRIYWSVWW